MLCYCVVIPLSIFVSFIAQPLLMLYPLSARLQHLDTSCSWELLQAAMEALDVRNDTSFNRESITKATGLFHSSTQCEFIIALVICREGLPYTSCRGINTKLQRGQLNSWRQSVTVVMETIQKASLKVEE